MKTSIGGNLTLRQESAVSSEFHQEMLMALATHHDEKATDWTQVNPAVMVAAAVKQLAMWIDDRDPKHLVHAANFESIAWAITESQRKPHACPGCKHPDPDPHEERAGGMWCLADMDSARKAGDDPMGVGPCY